VDRRRSGRRGRLLALTVIGAALILAACGSSSTSTSAPTSTSASVALAKPSGTPSASLVVNQSQAPGTIDPAFSEAAPEVGPEWAVYATLTAFVHVPGKVPGTSEGNLDVNTVKPYIAQSWKFSENDTTLTFQIRPGLKFPSGDPLNAEAVAWSLKRTIRAEGGAYSVIEENQFKPALIKSVTATGPLTVVIKYSRPAPNQLQIFAGPDAGSIYDPALVEAHGGQKPTKPNTWLATHDAGYGPYLLKSYEPNHQMVLEANPNFFEPPKTKRIVLNFIPSNETLLLDAQSGAADVTLGLSGEGAHSLEGQSCCVVTPFKSANAEMLNLPENKANKEFESQLFREALSHAIPYEGILKKVAYGYGKLYFGEWMPTFAAYDPTIGAAREYNLEKAKKLLAQSGIKTPITIPIYIAVGDNNGKEIATAVQGAWQPLGVNVQVKVISPADFSEVVYTTHTGPTIFYEGPAAVAPEYYWAYDLQCPKENPYNANLACVPAADKLMKEVFKTTNEATRQRLFDEADRLYVKDTPRIWVYNSEPVTVAAKDVTSVYLSDGLPDMRFWAKN
jgi:peptide/nickel transport system substrate-binding protein